MPNKPLIGPYRLDPFQSEIVKLEWGSGAPQPIGTWRVENVDLPQTGIGLSTACAFGDAGVTLYQTQFRANPPTQPPLPVSVSAGNVRFTGTVSGAVYNWLGPAQCLNAIFGVGDADPLDTPAGTFKRYAIWVYEPGATEYGSFAWQELAPGLTGFQDGEDVLITPV